MMAATLLAGAGGTAAAGAAGGAALSAGSLGLAAGGSLIPAATFASGTSLLGALSSGFSLASAASTLFGSMQKSNAIKADTDQTVWATNMQARETDLNARQEETRGKQEANNVMDAMIQTIAAQRAAYATAGVDINFGTPDSVQQGTRKLANLQMSTGREDALARVLSRRRQASALRESAANTSISGRSTASNALLSGMSSAGGSISDLIDRRIARG